MIVGVPKEIKNHEYRVGMVPSSVRELVARGHQVLIQSSAGDGVGFDDEAYKAVGATIVPTAADIFASADLVVKVKEPLAEERAMLREGQVLFTYLHLAPDRAQTEDLIKSKATCIAYETVTDAKGRLPLLAPMSEVAGRMALQAGAWCLQKSNKGSGVLLSGVPGVSPGKVVIIGGGVVGSNAARVAVGMRADVTVIDRNLDALRALDEEFGGQIKCVFSTSDSIERAVSDADLVVGAVLIPGAAAPKLVTEKHIQMMRPGSAVVDVAIDQGGCFETSRATTHSDPIYYVHDVVHYCVANMPGGVARTSTIALNNVTLPFIIRLADKGFKTALLEDEHFLKGLNVIDGHVTCPAVAAALGTDLTPAREYLAKL